MADKTVNKKTKAKKENKTPIAFDIDYDKLATAITLANKEYEETKELENQTRLEKERNDWYHKIGYNKDKHFTIILAFFRMLVMKSKDIKGDRATSTLLSFVASSIMSIGMAFMFLIMTISIIIFIFAENYIIGNIVLTRVLSFIIAFFAFVFGNLFRISVHEIRNMENRDYINTILSSILAIVGTILAFVEIFGGK